MKQCRKPSVSTFLGFLGGNCLLFLSIVNVYGNIMSLRSRCTQYRQGPDIGRSFTLCWTNISYYAYELFGPSECGYHRDAAAIAMIALILKICNKVDIFNAGTVSSLRNLFLSCVLIYDGHCILLKNHFAGCSLDLVFGVLY